MGDPRVEQFSWHSQETAAYHQTHKDHICSNAYCFIEPFCGEEFANHYHHWMECPGGTREGAYSSTLVEDIKTIQWLRRMERTHQVEVIAQAEYDPCNDHSLLLEPVHAHDGGRQIDHAKPETHAYQGVPKVKLHDTMICYTFKPPQSPPPSSTFQIRKARDDSNLRRFLLCPTLSPAFFRHSSSQNQSAEGCSRSPQHIRWYWWTESVPERKSGCWGAYNEGSAAVWRLPYHDVRGRVVYFADAFAAWAFLSVWIFQLPSPPRPIWTSVLQISQKRFEDLSNVFGSTKSILNAY